MLVLGLTGSMASGKSTVASMFAELGVATWNADDAVHRLYAGRAAPLVESAFPGTVKGGVVDRPALAAQVASNREALRQLEAIVHPLVREDEMEFRARALREGRRILLLDIPLLFEGGSDKRVDAVIVVSTDEAIRKARAMKRPGMTEERYAGLLARQMPDEEKRLRAHFIIDTSGELDATRRQVRGLMRALAGMAAGS